MQHDQKASTPRNLCYCLEYIIPAIVLDLHLDHKCLELAQRRLLASHRSIFRYQTRDVNTQIGYGGEEDLTIDGLVEVWRKHEGCEYEKNSHKRKAGCDSFCDRQCLQLPGSQAGHVGCCCACRWIQEVVFCSVYDFIFLGPKWTQFGPQSRVRGESASSCLLQIVRHV